MHTTTQRRKQMHYNLVLDIMWLLGKGSNQHIEQTLRLESSSEDLVNLNESLEMIVLSSGDDGKNVTKFA